MSTLILTQADGSMREVTLPDSFDILIPKAGQKATIAFADYPDNAIAHFLEYGVRQLSVDATASVDKDAPDRADKAMALVNKRLANMKEGKIRDYGGRTTDEVEALAWDMAEREAKEELKRKSVKVSSDDGKKQVAKLTAEKLEKYAYFRTIARETIERRDAAIAAAQAESIVE